MQSNGVGSASPRGMQQQAVIGVEVGKVLVGEGEQNTDELQ